jgi:signal transduction histidine kinase
VSARIERLVVLAVAGTLLAIVRQLAPFLWPFDLPSSWSLIDQLWLLAIDLLWVAAMLVTWWRDPAGRMWKLFLLYLVVGAIGVSWVFPTSLTWTLSQLSIGFASVVFVHLLLAFPSGHLSDRFDRLLVGGAYLWIVATRLVWVLVWRPTVDKVGFSPRNPFVFWPNAELAWLFGPGAILLLAPILAIGALLGLWRHWERASPVQRRSLLPIVVAAPLQLAITVAWHFAGAGPPEWGAIRAGLVHPLVGAAGLVFPVGFLLGSLRAMWARAGIADLAVEIARGVPLGGLRDTLARALDDPTLVLAFPAPAGEELVDADGRSVELPSGGSTDRAVARVEHDDELLAVLVYDPAIEREDPGRVAAIASVAQLALENERLAAQVRAQLEEVRASRARIVEAGDFERRRIERDLHDGAQQRLVALVMRLDQARTGSQDTTTLIDRTTAELHTAINEVRELARGLHPTILTDAGLGAAVEALAERTPIPVITNVPNQRFSADVEAAAYFVIAEGMTNAARHSGAGQVRVDVSATEEQLIVAVTDDGRGGADMGGGSGLRGLADRVAALGGELRVISPPGTGTTLTAVLPQSMPGLTRAATGANPRIRLAESGAGPADADALRS